MKVVVLFLLLSAAAFGQAPVLFYSDLLTATCSAASPNGVGNKGAIVTVTGKNFGSSQDASHYVTMTPSGGGSPVTLDSYPVWNGDTFTTPTTGNKTIAFQPATTGGGCPTAGDYLIKVVTPSGTSNSLPLHIYSGGTIYFVDNVGGHNGSDSNNGKYAVFSSGTNGPFLTMSACRAAVVAAAGNICYAMPNSWFSGSDAGYSSVITMIGVYGTASANMAILGYPTASTSDEPKLNCPDNVTVGCTPTNFSFNLGSDSVSGGAVAYITVANFTTYYYGSSYGVLEAGNQDYSETPHHIRLINVDMSAPVNITFALMVVPVLTTYSQFYGLNCHDLNNTDNAAQHVGCFYLGDGANTVDICCSVFDMNCSIAGTCANNKGIEVHSTGKYFGPLRRPTFQAGAGSARGDVFAAGGGSLGAGTYDVFLTYRSRLYYADNAGQAANWIPDAANCFNTSSCHSIETESDDSNAAGHLVTVTLTGAAGSNAIGIKWPTGVDHRPVVNAADWDGVSTLCNPTLAYKVYACKEGTSCGGGPLYQGQNDYTDPSAGIPITSTDYAITSINTGNWAYTRPTLDGSGAPTGSLATGQHYTASMSGCNIRNVSIHDNWFMGWPGYVLTLYGIGIDSGSYFRVYNNIFANSGTGWSWNQQDQYRVPVAINNPNNDVDMRDYASGGDMEFANNTFFDSGGPSDAYNSPGLLSAEWYSVASYPTKRFLFTNNIIRQPLNYAARDGWITSTAALTNLGGNFFVTGSNNICYGYSGANCSGTGYNFNAGGSGINSSPLFTSEGSLSTSGVATTFCQSGLDCYPTAYTGYDLTLQGGSPAWNAGTAVAYVTTDINGVPRPTPPSIGPYEQAAGGGSSGGSLKGKAKAKGKAKIY